MTYVNGEWSQIKNDQQFFICPKLIVKKKHEGDFNAFVFLQNFNPPIMGALSGMNTAQINCKSMTFNIVEMRSFAKKNGIEEIYKMPGIMGWEKPTNGSHYHIMLQEVCKHL